MFVLSDRTETTMEEEPEGVVELARAGFACSELISNPAGWINRRVETVEILSHEETRRRVSVDFTLPERLIGDLDTGEGVAIPLSIHAKQPRRHFDLNDESGSAVPVMGRQQNTLLAHTALFGLAVDLLQTAMTPDERTIELGDLLWQVVAEPEADARHAANFLTANAAAKGSWMAPLARDQRFMKLLRLFAGGYLLVALLEPETRSRRILKFGYGDDFPTHREAPNPWWKLSGAKRRWSSPDGFWFPIDTPMSEWAESFHLEVAIPEELRGDMHPCSQSRKGQRPRLASLSATLTGSRFTRLRATTRLRRGLD